MLAGLNECKGFIRQMKEFVLDCCDFFWTNVSSQVQPQKLQISKKQYRMKVQKKKVCRSGKHKNSSLYILWKRNLKYKSSNTLKTAAFLYSAFRSLNMSWLNTRTDCMNYSV